MVLIITSKGGLKTSDFSGNELNACQSVDFRAKALPPGNSLGKKSSKNGRGEQGGSRKIKEPLEALWLQGEGWDAKH